jgi:ATP-binding cassette, subfamily C, bacterial PrsD
MTKTADLQAPLRQATKGLLKPLFWISIISLLLNLLMLTGPMFMLLVNDKVLSSKSVPTLIALSSLALILYAFSGLLEDLRGRILTRMATIFDHSLAPRLFDATLRLPLQIGPHSRNHDPLQDLAMIRNFLMGAAAPTALLDLPWMPIYFLFLFLVHPVLAMAGLIGSALLVGLAIIKHLCSQNPSVAASQQAAMTQSILFDARRNAEAAAAMSMGDDLCRRWGSGYVNSIAAAGNVADSTSIFGAISKTMRFVLQSAMLAVGSFLVIDGGMSPGAMIASSIILARALAPMDQVIAFWRQYTAVLQSYRRLRSLMAMLPQSNTPSCELPRPCQSLTVRDVAIVPPGAHTATVSGVSFELEAGDALGIIGPSGCGKSTLVRALVGAWTVSRGEIRFDDALISQHSADMLGSVIGHLPQSIELFDGTIAENIGRFRKSSDGADVIAAAKLAGVHEMILSFPKGYDTPVGEGGQTLSGGQRQRIGLARAVFGNPFLVVLDEPNSNLDPIGEQSLNEAIQRIRQTGKIVIIVAHRPSAIFAANKILSLRNGRAEMFGPKGQVLSALFPRTGQQQKPISAPVNQPRHAAAPQPAANVTMLDTTRGRQSRG